MKDDKLIWNQILRLARIVPPGDLFEFDLAELVKGIGWPKSVQHYDRAHEAILSLATTTLSIDTLRPFGVSERYSLLEVPVILNDNEGKASRYSVRIPKGVILISNAYQDPVN